MKGAPYLDDQSSYFIEPQYQCISLRERSALDKVHWADIDILMRVEGGFQWSAMISLASYIWYHKNH